MFLNSKAKIAETFSSIANNLFGEKKPEPKVEDPRLWDHNYIWAKEMKARHARNDASQKKALATSPPAQQLSTKVELARLPGNRQSIDGKKVFEETIVASRVCERVKMEERVVSKRFGHRDSTKKMFDFEDKNMIRWLNTKELFSHETNRLKNMRNINNLFNNPEVLEVNLYGYTKLAGTNYNFPVYCSRREYVTFLSELAAHPDKRILIEDGILTQNMLECFPWVWKNFFAPATVTCSSGTFISTLNELMFYFMLFCLLFFTPMVLCSGFEVLEIRTISTLFGFGLLFISSIFGLLGLAPLCTFQDNARLISVIIEEFIKRYSYGFNFHYGSGFAFFEYFWKLTSMPFGPHYVAAALPIFMHMAATNMDFVSGVLFHYFWNTYFAPYVESFLPHPCDWIEDRVFDLNGNQCVDKCSPDFLRFAKMAPWNYRNVTSGVLTFEGVDFELVEEISYTLDLLRKVYQKDILGLTLSAGMKANFFSAVLEALSMNDFDSLVNAVHQDLVAPMETETVLTGLESPFVNILNMVVPEFVSKSPTTRRVLAFAFVIASTPFCANLAIMRRFSDLIRWDTLPDGGSFMEISISTIKAVYDGINRVATSGNWKDLFGLSDDVRFVSDARLALTESINPGATVDEVTNHIKRLDDLLEKRKFKWNEGQVGILMSKIQEQIAVIKTRCLDEPFTTRAYEILDEIAPKLTVSEMVDRLNLMRTLIHARQFVKNDSTSSKLLDRLHSKVTEYETMLLDVICRKHPYCVNFMGVAGFGKSSILDALANALAVKDGEERFVGDTLIYLLGGKYPCESGIHKFARILKADDIAFDFSNDKQSGVEPGDIFFQRFINKTPFEIMAAFDKGIILNNIKYGFFTTNHRSFIGSGPAKKLERRFNMGVNVECFFADGMSFEEVQSLAPEDRNLLMRFKLMKCVVKDDKDKVWTFEPMLKKVGEKTEEIVFNLQEFIQYVITKSIEHDKREELEWKMFNSVTNQCRCGVPRTFHAKGVGNYVKLMSKCYNYNRIMAQELANEALPFAEEVDDDAPTAISVPSSTRLTSINFEVSVNVWALLVLYFVYQYASVAYNRVYDDVREFAYRNKSTYVASSWYRQALTAKLRFDGWDDLTADIGSRLYVFYSKIQCYYILHKKKIMSLMAAMSAGLFYKWYFKTQMTGTPIFREEVDPKSLVLLEPTREQQWTAEQRRSWGVESKEITILRPHKVGVGYDDLLRISTQAVRQVEIRNPHNYGQVRKGLCVFWSPQWVSINKHFIPKEWKQVEITINGVVQRYEITEFISFGESELYLFSNLFDPSCFPLADFLAEDLGKGPFVVTCPHYKFSGMAAFSKAWSSHDSQWYPSVAIEQTASQGDCGNLILANAYHGWIVLGVQFASTPGYSHFTPLSRKDYQSVKKDLFPYIHSFSPEDNVLTAIGPLYERSETRHLDSPLLIPIGSLGKNNSSFHSKIVKTRIYDDVAPRLKHDWAIPNKVKGENGFGEWKHAFLQFFRVVSYRCDKTMFEMMEGMYCYLNDAIPMAEIKKNGWSVRPLSGMEAIFGSGSIGVDRAKFDTSCGPFWKELGVMDKYDLFEEVEGDYKYAFRKDYTERLQALEARVKTGCLPYLDAQFSYKDEVRKSDKLAEFLIRLFSVPNFHFNHLMRCSVMPIVSFLLDHPLWSECYGGMNAGSKQWHQLAMHLRKHKFFIDMDFTGFDTTHRLAIITIVARFFYLASQRLGYTEEEAKLVFYLVSMLMVQRVIFGKDIMLKMFGLPSGIIITLIMNSIVNSILMRIAFKELVNDIPLKEFQKYVSAATTGDDNASGISEVIIDRYNMVTIAPVYFKMGYTVTAADKAKTVVPHIPFEKLTFLKRSFRFDDELGLYVAPIDTDSLYKSLCFQEQKLGVAGDTRLKDCALSAQREAFLHGKQYFDELQTWLEGVFKKHQMTLVFQKLDWETIKSEYQAGEFRTFMC